MCVCVCVCAHTRPASRVRVDCSSCTEDVPCIHNTPPPTPELLLCRKIFPQHVSGSKSQPASGPGDSCPAHKISCSAGIEKGLSFFSRCFLCSPIIIPKYFCCGLLICDSKLQFTMDKFCDESEHCEKNSNFVQIMTSCESTFDDVHL